MDIASVLLDASFRSVQLRTCV